MIGNLEQYDYGRCIELHRLRILKGERIMELKQYMLSMGFQTEEHEDCLDLSESGDMEFDEQKARKHRFDDGFEKLRKQIHLDNLNKDSQLCILTCILASPGQKGGLTNLLTKWRQDGTSRVVDQNPEDPLSTIHSMMERELYAEVIEFTSKVCCSNPRVHELTQAWTALAHIFLHESSSPALQATYSHLAEAIDICQSPSLQRSTTANFILLYLALAYYAELHDFAMRTSRMERYKDKPMIQEAEYYAGLLREIEEEQLEMNLMAPVLRCKAFVSFLAIGYMQLRSEDPKERSFGEKLLVELAQRETTMERVEPYVALFYSIPNFGADRAQLELLDNLFLLLNACQRSTREQLIISGIYARALINHQKHAKAFNLLQLEYAKHSNYGHCLLHLYGKQVIKSRNPQYLHSAISALTVSEASQANSAFYLFVAYSELGNYDLAFRPLMRFLSKKGKDVSPNKMKICSLYFLRHCPMENPLAF